MNLWKAQNDYFHLREEHMDDELRAAEAGDEKAARWLSAFKKLGPFMKINPKLYAFGGSGIPP